MFVKFPGAGWDGSLRAWTTMSILRYDDLSNQSSELSQTKACWFVLIVKKLTSLQNPPGHQCSNFSHDVVRQGQRQFRCTVFSTGNSIMAKATCFLSPSYPVSLLQNSWWTSDTLHTEDVAKAQCAKQKLLSVIGLHLRLEVLPYFVVKASLRLLEEVFLCSMLISIN